VKRKDPSALEEERGRELGRAHGIHIPI